MFEQIFISYRREGGNSTAKLICDELKKLGLTVFYDHESILNEDYKERIRKAIENCVDFVLILTPNALDPRITEEDWMRLEIELAIKNQKNIIAVKDKYFAYPKSLPENIAKVKDINNVPLYFDYFDAGIEKIVKLLKSVKATEPPKDPSFGLKFKLNKEETGYIVSNGSCDDAEIIIPSSYKNLPVTDIGFVGFGNREYITDFCLPDSILKIHNYAFGKCTSLTSLTLPERVRVIGEGAFKRCTALKKIRIPNKVKQIENELFYECVSLTEITLPAGIKSIGAEAFYGCAALTDIFFGGSIAEWEAIRMDSSCPPPQAVTVHCIDGEIEF